MLRAITVGAGDRIDVAADTAAHGSVAGRVRDHRHAVAAMADR
jgi:hypothetical protein